MPDVPLALAPFAGRLGFGPHLTALGLTGAAVEVGTHRGRFAARFLAGWGGRLLTCVDPWAAGYDPGDPAALGDRAADRRAALAALSAFPGRFRVLDLTSAAAAPTFAADSLDFVYIDGDHRPEHVRADLAAWWPKVRPGGLLAGHDFLCPGENAGGWGRFVQPEVLAFAAGRTVHMVFEPENHPWSWYVVKPPGDA